MFEAFENRSGPVTADEIAKFTGAERPLISRIMRAMNVTGVFKEHGHEKYVHNNLSLKLMDPTIRAMATGFSGNTGALLPMMPDYIAHMNGRNPGDLSPNFVHFATKGANNSFFDYIQPRPALLSRFSKSMRADTLVNQAHVQSLVSSLFPENDQTQTNGSPDADNHVTMIDVGGGRGNVLNSLRKARPELRGRFMVQDLPQEVEGRESADGVEAMAHDFFTPQPIIGKPCNPNPHPFRSPILHPSLFQPLIADPTLGASVYFFRHIFHDWSDAQSQRILTNLIPAMSAESRIVIADAVLLDEGAGSFQVLRDIVMMALGGCERTESQWRTLLEGVGLRITRIVTSSGEARNRDGLIEAVKA